jgi:hypothetical protein
VYPRRHGFARPADQSSSVATPVRLRSPPESDAMRVPERQLGKDALDRLGDLRAGWVL